MSIGSRIKEARINKGLTQSALALKIGITKGAIANYENEISTPKIEIIYKLFEILDCDANYLYQDDLTKTIDFKCSFEEQAIVNKYRGLDNHGKEVVDSLLDAEIKRIEEENEKNKSLTLNVYKLSEEVPKTETAIIDFYTSKAAAGTGSFLTDDISCDVYIPVEKASIGADFSVEVSGDSMEPLLSNGDLLLVEKQQNINHGDLGVFIVNGMGYVKRFYNKNNICKLVSLNIDYEDIVFQDGDEVECIGKVLDSVPSGEWSGA